MITNPTIAAYIEQYSNAESEILSSLNKVTQETVPGSQMISGHLQGQFLQIISKMLQPKFILELGTYTGYSAICLASGLTEGGVLHTIDIDEGVQEIRDKYWKEAQLDDKIVQHIGDASTVLGNLNIPFDLVFIDADKRNYELYFDLILPKLNSGAMILADNVLFRAEVVLENEERSKIAAYMHEFNQKIANDDRVEQVILPLRDGISFIRKK